MVNISIGTALLTALLGYAVVFLGIVFLMVVILIMGKAMTGSKKTQTANDTNINLGSVSAPAGVDPKKVAAAMAAIAEMEREG